jgi:phage-related protein
MTIQQDLKQSALPNYIELFVLDCTAIGGGIDYITPSTVAGSTPIVFGGNTYTPMPITGSGWETSIDGAAPQPLLKVSNVTKYLQSQLSTYKDLVGARLTRFQTFDKYLDAASITRRNLLNYSEHFDHASWTKNALGSITANTVASPFGNTTADTLTTTASAGGFYNVSGAVSALTTYTGSIYAKAGSVTSFKMELSNQNESATCQCQVDLTNGTAGAITGSFTNTKVSVQDVGNGWYRVALTGTTLASGSTSIGIYPRLLAIGTVHFFGAQCEVGSVASAYQYTTTTHQPFADSTQVFGTSVYTIEQKTKQSKYEIEFRLASIVDVPQMKLPRQQVLRTEFPGAGLFRK